MFLILFIYIVGVMYTGGYIRYIYIGMHRRSRGVYRWIYLIFIYMIIIIILFTSFNIYYGTWGWVGVGLCWIEGGGCCWVCDAAAAALL